MKIVKYGSVRVSTDAESPILASDFHVDCEGGSLQEGWRLVLEWAIGQLQAKVKEIENQGVNL